MGQNFVVRASSNIDRRFVLPAIVIAASATLVYSLVIFIFDPALWFNASTFDGTLFAIIVGLGSFLFVAANTKSSEGTVRLASVWIAIVSIFILLSLFLMVIPFVLAGNPPGFSPYNDPSNYVPYSWDGVGDFFLSFQNAVWCIWAYQLMVMSLAALVSTLFVRPSSFTKLQWRWSIGFVVGSTIYIFGLLLPLWSTIAEWLYD